MRPKFFQHQGGKAALPIFFPDATRAVVKMLDSKDVKNTGTPGVLVNTYHLWREVKEETLAKFGGIAKFMNWDGAVISDSGGFQVMSQVKKGVVPGKITDQGIIFKSVGKKKMIFTPEESIRFQYLLKTDLMVVLDDFTDPKASYSEAKESVERTIFWAERSKSEFNRLFKNKKDRPYLIGVVQGGEFKDLRKECTQALVKIGFDGLGWGGWPIVNGRVNFATAQIIAENSPKDYLLYGLGIGKPEDIVKCLKLGFSLFDCVLPTRDGRHGRLYVFRKDNFKTFTRIDITKNIFLNDKNPVDVNCDCLLCTNYSRSYLNHLFRIKDVAGMRLASIHNLRFYFNLLKHSG